MLIRSTSPRQTAEIAKKLAKDARRERYGAKNALVIGLSGDLGAGKTEFVKSFVRSMGIRARVTSPTFLLSRQYPLKEEGGRLFHLDAYRISTPKEMESAGIKDAIKDPKNVVLVEWGEKIKPMLPKDTTWIQFRHGSSPNERLILFRKPLHLPVETAPEEPEKPESTPLLRGARTHLKGWEG